MKKNKWQIAKRYLTAGLLTTTVVGVSALAMHAPAQNQNSLTGSFKSIQTDKATLFYADARPSCARFVEQVLPGTSESKAATENLKLVVAAL